MFIHQLLLYEYDTVGLYVGQWRKGVEGRGWPGVRSVPHRILWNAMEDLKSRGEQKKNEQRRRGSSGKMVGLK